MGSLVEEELGREGRRWEERGGGDGKRGREERVGRRGEGRRGKGGERKEGREGREGEGGEGGGEGGRGRGGMEKGGERREDRGERTYIQQSLPFYLRTCASKPAFNTYIVAYPWSDPTGLPGVHCKQVSAGVDKRQYMDIAILVTIQQL